MSETGRVLKPANENPWYVLMTLYGEQDGEEVDEALHEKNRAAWNAWAGQSMTEEQRAIAAKDAGIEADELASWPDMERIIHKRLALDRRSRAAVMAKELISGRGVIEMGGLIFNKLISIKSMIFNLPLIMNKSVFSGNFDAERARFAFGVGINGVIFNGDFWMPSAVFSGRANFNNTTYNKTVWFSHSKFKEGASFHGTEVKGDFWAPGVNFINGINMGAAKFHEISYFADAVFEGGAVFESSSFCGDAIFDKVDFKDTAIFRNSKFLDVVSFANSIFNQEVPNSRIDFTDCIFSRSVSFRDALFKMVYPNFSGAVLHDQTKFTAKSHFWPRDKQIDPEQAKASCAVIRHNLGKQGLPEEEHFFFRREMGFAAQIGGWWQRLPYRVFGMVSDFGYSIQRPALWLFGLWLSVAMINHVVLQWAATRHSAEYHVVQAFGLSFANQFPVFGLQARWFSADFLSCLNPWLKALGGAQTVVALPLLFFFALGLRTRFRMR